MHVDLAISASDLAREPDHVAADLDHAVALGEHRLADRPDPGQRGRGAEGLEALGQVGRHDVGPGDPQPDRGQVAVRGAGLEQGPVHRRHPHERRAATLLDDVEALVVPPDLAALLDGDPEARANFEDVSAEAWADAGAAITEGFAAAFADDPQVQVAFEQSMEEARKIDGMAVRTTTTFVAVAPGQQFDRAAVIDPQPSGPSIAQQAGRAAIGGLMGRLGRRSAEPEPAEPAQPTQSVMFSVTSEVRNVSTQSVDASMFEVPAGYTEQAM